MAQDPLTGHKVPNCSSMNEHCKYVWENFIARGKCPAQTLTIMAHSGGGRCVAQLYKDYKRELLERVRCLVFTDAYYHAMFQSLTAREANSLKSYSIHYKCFKAGHPKELGTVFQTQQGAILEVSAGTDQHAYSTGNSVEAIASFMLEKLS